MRAPGDDMAGGLSRDKLAIKWLGSGTTHLTKQALQCRWLREANGERRMGCVDWTSGRREHGYTHTRNVTHQECNAYCRKHSHQKISAVHARGRRGRGASQTLDVGCWRTS